MSGHRHNPSAGTQNQGNTLGDRSCVRQSKLYRQYESGNGVKDILGSSHLCWNENFKEGAYKGQRVFDHNAPTAGNFDQSIDPRYVAQDMKKSINNSQSNYSKPPADRRQSLTKYEDQDRSISNIGNYQQSSRNQYQEDGGTFRSSRNRHDVPEPIETTYKSLKAQKNRDDTFREQGKGSYEDSHSLARYAGRDDRDSRGSGGAYGGYGERAPYGTRDVTEDDDNYNKYSDRNYGARGGARGGYSEQNDYSDENYGGRGNANTRNNRNDDSREVAYERGNNGRMGASGKGNQSTRPW